MLQFKNILITGASSGIGEALALYYASRGAENLFLCGRNSKRLSSVAKACRQENSETVIHTKTLDVTDRDAIKTWIEECEAEAPLNLVFANAGVSTGAETAENIYKTFDTNIYGVLNTVLPVIDIFKHRPHPRCRTIAITSSIAGYHGLMTCPSYSASKAAVKTWGEALRPALKPFGIHVSVICPGFVRSRITDKNTCPMPYFMEADKAAAIIADGLSHNVGLIAFPWQMRLVSWLGAALPNWLSEFIYSRLPYKV